MSLAAAPLASTPIADLPGAGAAAAPDVGEAELPIRILVGPVGEAVLPLRIVVGEIGAATLPLQISMVDPALVAGTASVADAGSQAAVWGALVRVAGLDVSDRVVGEIVVEFEEGSARIAEFTLHQAGESVILPDWTQKPVQIFIADLRSGAPVNALPLFFGVVDLPRLHLSNGTVELRCTDNRQAIISGLSRAGIDGLVGGFWSPAVFDRAAGSWVYANDRLSTVPASLDLSPTGELRLTSWVAKAEADLAFGEDQVLENSVTVDIAEGGSLINQIDIDFGYRFPRLKAEGYALNYDFLTLHATSFVYWVRDGNKFLLRASVLSAIESAGGSVVSIDWIALPTVSQVIPGVGGGTAGVWIPNPTTDPNLCLGFSAIVSFDYTQQAEEQHRITVFNAASVARGLLRDEMSGALQGVYAEPLAVEQGIILYKAGVTTIPPLETAPVIPLTTNALTPTLTADTNRAAAEAAMQTLVAIAMTRIYASHRRNTGSASVPLHPLLDTEKTVAIDAQGVVARGKVRRGVHRLNPAAGTAITEFDLALCSVAGVGIVHPADEVIAPAGSEDGTQGVLGTPTVVWNGLAAEDGALTITFPGVEEYQRSTAVEVIASAFAAPLHEDALTINL